MKSKYTKDNSDIRDQVSVLSPQSSGFSGPDPDLGIAHSARFCGALDAGSGPA